VHLIFGHANEKKPSERASDRSKKEEEKSSEKHITRFKIQKQET